MHAQSAVGPFLREGRLQNWMLLAVSTSAPVGHRADQCLQEHYGLRISLNPDDLPARANPQAIGARVITPFVQRDKIPHGSLVWEDFKGKVPKKAKYEAATYSDLEDPALCALVPKNAAVDTGEPCRVKGKELPDSLSTSPSTPAN
ncbi:MAG: hypothetical protein H0X43_07535 [Nitrosospira sp.]|nr:hypothetical protein [Nitrosospira sp.]